MRSFLSMDSDYSGKLDLEELTKAARKVGGSCALALHAARESDSEAVQLWVLFLQPRLKFLLVCILGFKLRS